MKRGLLLSKLAIAAFVAAALTACGGGGGGSSALQSGSAVLPTAPGTSAPAPANGPVEYLQSVGPMTSSGSIAKGTQQAIVAVMSDQSPSGNTFEDDTLSVSAQVTTGNAFRRRNAFYRESRPAQERQVEAFPANDRALLGKLAAHGVDGVAPQERRTQGVLQGRLKVGSTASIWVEAVGSSNNVQVPATLVYQTAHGNIWLDDTLLNGPAQSGAAQIGADFENAYASDTDRFASPDYSSSAPGLQAQYQTCDSSGKVVGSGSAYVTEPADHRIDVMVVNPDNLGGYGGYFAGANLMTQGALNCLNGGGTQYESNQAPFIFVGWFSSQSANYELQEDLVRGTAHEFQHLINFVNHTILAAGASKPGFNGSESTYINEGLSMLAQDLAVKRMYAAQNVEFDVDDALSRASAYLANPGNFSISAFSGIDSPVWGGYGSPQYNCFGGCYGGAYLFERYLRDRFGSDAYTHEIETSGAVGSQNLEQVTGESAGDLLDDFALAMAAGSLGVNPEDARFNFGTLGLTQTYVDQFGQTHSLGGVNAQPLNGNAATVTAPIGGFAFVSVSTVPAGGSPVTVTDKGSVSGFGLAGGLAQH